MWWRTGAALEVNFVLIAIRQLHVGAPGEQAVLPPDAAKRLADCSSFPVFCLLFQNPSRWTGPQFL
jgi:hypothetical protein